MATKTDARRTIKCSEKNYQEVKKIKHKNMVESMDAALTIALGTHKKELKEAKDSEKDKTMKGKL